MKYFLRVWIAIVVVAPILYWTPNALRQPDLTKGLSFIPILFVSIILGFVLSTPTMVFFYFANDYFSKPNLAAWKSKSMLALLLVAGIFATFTLIDSSLLFASFENFLFPGSYIVSSIWAVAVFKQNYHR